MIRWAALAFALLACAGVAGCSLLGMNYRDREASRWWTQKTAKTPDEYAVQRITPQLLSTQAKQRRAHEVGAANPALAQAVANYAYRVEPRDVLSVLVWGDSAQTSIFTPVGAAGGGTGGAVSSAAAGTRGGFKVGAGGAIYFPFVGSVHVAGETVEQIRAKLAKRMTPYLKNPQITVGVAQFDSQKYQISGTVVKPGLYPITDQPLTVSQAIAAAGGVVHQVPNTITSGNTIPRALGDLSRVLYVHDGKTSVLNLRALELYGDASQNRLVHAGDTIQVPDNSSEQIHLIGEVQHVGNYPLDNGRLNLAQALGDAGGLNLTTANPARIFVFRGAYEKPQVFWLDARSPQAMLLAADFELKPQDVVYVATAGVSTWDRIITQILPTVQTLYETKVLVNP